MGAHLQATPEHEWVPGVEAEGKWFVSENGKEFLVGVSVGRVPIKVLVAKKTHAELSISLGIRRGRHFFDDGHEIDVSSNGPVLHTRAEPMGVLATQISAGTTDDENQSRLRGALEQRAGLERLIHEGPILDSLNGNFGKFLHGCKRRCAVASGCRGLG